jgi:hypothetical protein
MVDNEEMSTIQTVDIEVSREKFEDELTIFLNRQDAHRENGIILLKAAFPDIELLFIAKQLIPAPVVFSVRINYTNYDLEPLSVSFINPFTGDQLRANQMLTNFSKKSGVDITGNLIRQPLLQAESHDSIPFLCVPGVREYHNHPFHTGDSWLLHRKLGGEGSLGYLIDKLYDFGISAISTFNLPIISIPVVQLGLDLNKLPE